LPDCHCFAALVVDTCWQTAVMTEPRTPDQPDSTLGPEDLDDLREFIRVQVAAGYAPAPEIVAEAVQVFADTTLAPDVLQAAATALAEAALAAHGADQESWPETTDCDRLSAAFSALAGAGIVARQHFSCCSNCGATEIHDEMDQAAKDGTQVRGYTFFHMQDTEHAVEGEPLFLSYGAADSDKEAAVAIGHEVVAALREQGLDPAWNGRHANRIGLPLVWQRRR
jgi:hypothetical protein